MPAFFDGIGPKHKHIIKRHARRRDPLPDNEVRIRSPKSLPMPPQKPSMLTMLPMLAMALATGGASFFLFRGSGQGVRVLFTALPMVLMVTMMMSVQRYLYRQAVKNHIREAERINSNYGTHLQDIEKQLQQYASLQHRILNDESPPLSELLQRVKSRSRTLWERQPFDNDFLAVRISTGSRPISVKMRAPEWDGEDKRLEAALTLMEKYSRVNQLPLTANLNQLGTIGIRGQGRSEALYLTFTILANIVVHHSPDEVNLYVFSRRPNAQEVWNWLRWLPHTNVVDGGHTGQARISLRPETDESILIELSQMLRSRADKQNRQMAGSDVFGKPEPHIVIVFDQTPHLQGHIVMNMLLAHDPSQDTNHLRASAIFVEKPIPPQISAMVQVDGNQVEYRETWAPDANSMQHMGQAELATPKQMERLARSMAPLRTEENYASGGSLPGSVRLVELFGADQAEEIELKQLYGTTYEPRRVLSFPVGLNVDQKPLVVHLRETGLAGYGSHAMLAGMTGTGKSVLLQAMVLSMALTNPPAYLNFVLADFKGGASELAKIKDLPHLVGFVTDLNQAMVERFRLALESEVLRRKTLFDSAKERWGQPVANIRDYNKLRPESPLPHLVILLDEFAHGIKINPSFRETMDTVAAQGRALGMHLVLSTQRAADFDSKIRPNIDIRISLRVASKEDSKTMLNRDEAYTSLTRPGQAYIQVGDNELFEMFQAARADLPYSPTGSINIGQVDEFAIYRVANDGRRQLLYKNESFKKQEASDNATVSEAEILVDHIRAYCTEHYPYARVICLPPLPEASEMPLATLLQRYPGSYRSWQGECWTEVNAPQQRLTALVGMLDLPSQQDQRPFLLNLNERDGNCMVIGPAGSGRSLFLRTLLMSLAATHTPDDVQFYILAGGNTLEVFDKLPHCGAVIRLTDSERVSRLLTFLQQEIKHRQALMKEHRLDSLDALRQAQLALSLPSIILVLEDFAGFKANFEDRWIEIESLSAAGVAADIHLILASVTLNHVHPRLQSNFQTRVALGLKSAIEYQEVLGQRREAVGDVRGRGYTNVISQEVLECQIAAPLLVLEAGRQENWLLRDTVQAMNEAWNGHRPLPIEKLEKHISLEGLWQRFPPAESHPHEMITAPIGQEYQGLGPVIIDLKQLEMFSLVIGPAGSGKTDFLITLCLAAATALPPERLAIAIFALQRPPSDLLLLRGLPHVQYAGNRREAQQLLRQLAQNLQEKATEHRSLEEEGTGNTQDLSQPVHTLIIVDDVQSFARAGSEFPGLLDQCAEHGRELGMNLIFTGTANALGMMRTQSQYFGFQSLQSAIKYMTGVTFALDQPSWQLLGLQLPGSLVRAHEADFGRGRAYFAHQDKYMAQIGTWRSPEGKEIEDRTNLERLVAHISEKHRVASIE